MNNKTQLNLRVFNLDGHPPSPIGHHFPAQPEAPHVHLPMEQLHQRSHRSEYLSG